MADNLATIVVKLEPDQLDRAAVVEPLLAFNKKAGGPSGFVPVAILIQDPETEKPAGGLWGRISYDWLFVELFVVPEKFRGRDLGSNILARAEGIAREHGCVGAWLDTYEFQAPAFYKKQGYELFATIADHPRGKSRFFFKKIFT